MTSESQTFFSEKLLIPKEHTFHLKRENNGWNESRTQREQNERKWQEQQQITVKDKLRARSDSFLFRSLSFNSSTTESTVSSRADTVLVICFPSS